MYYRISYDGYIENDFKNEREAIDDFISYVMDFTKEDWKDEITIEVFSDETNEWE